MTSPPPPGTQPATGDLRAFVDASPSPFHAVAGLAARLDEAGFVALDERDAWKLEPGQQAYVVRDGGSIVAFRVGTDPPSHAGFRLIGAHTDSPTFKVRPLPDVRRHGWSLVGVETYGGGLWHTWMDRDLTVAGRVVSTEGDHLVRLPGAPLRLASLAIHLDRSVQEKVQLNAQQHLVPLWSTSEAEFLATVAAEAGVPAAPVLGHDLVLAPVEPAAVGGRDGEFVFAPRLDNLLSCHTGCDALIAAPTTAATQVLVASDHEEVGSGTAEGARGPHLEHVLGRIVDLLADADPQALARALAASLLVSADTAHAVHPNYAERYEPGHLPRMGGGPVIKHNANQAYASDAATVAWFAARCGDVGVKPQHFVTRADEPSGSTIGPLTATRLGIPTVDVGVAILSMHSVREQAGAADIRPFTDVLTAHLAA